MVWVRRLLSAVLVGACVAWLTFGGHQWTQRLLHAAKPGVTLEGHLVTGMLAHELETLVRALAAGVERVPRDAAVERSTGRIIPDLPGLAVDVRATVSLVLQAGPGTGCQLVVFDVPPRFTTADVSSLTRTLGAYATIIAGTPERRSNIRLAASLLDNTLLYPGQAFSFNFAIGPVTESRGFQEAPVIVGEELVPGVGGGICQVSTTLFNAAVAAGLAVLERHGHSQPVSYVPEGRDATVAQYYKDLKLRNTTGRPVLIRAGSDGHRVWFTVLGPAQAGP
ncbi:MAG: VanW family protein [Bacillota bacterium]